MTIAIVWLCIVGIHKFQLYATKQARVRAVGNHNEFHLHGFGLFSIEFKITLIWDEFELHHHAIRD